MSTTPAEVAAAWAPIEAWLQRERPDLAEGLQSAASKDALDELGALGVPAEWRALWAQHDGEGPVLLGGWSFLPVTGGVESVLVERDNLMEMGRHLAEEPPPTVEGPARAVWAHQSWIPFATDYNGSYLCIDLAPTNEGRPGQVLLVDNDERRVVYAGLLEMLDECRSRMEDGFHPDDETELDSWTEDPADSAPSVQAPTNLSDTTPTPAPDSTPVPAPMKAAVPTPPAESVAEPEVRGDVELVDGDARLELVLTGEEQAEGTTAFVRSLDDNIVGVMIPKGGRAGARLRFPGLGGAGHDLLLVVEAVR